jgi:putative Mn2+ efflux pump MntP
MSIVFSFLLNSILLGVALAMDAFSLSIANAIAEPNMTLKKIFTISGTFAAFQALMPIIGWLCVHTVASYFRAFRVAIPWIALILLAFIGGKMILDAKKGEFRNAAPVVSLTSLLMQGIATSIDALSVGFTIAEYSFSKALICSIIIALTTFVICCAGTRLGKKIGVYAAGKAPILGGLILIGIGLEIFLTSIL